LKRLSLENVQSMLKLGRAQGVAMAAALSRDIPITEYEPKKIKMNYWKEMPLKNK
jgi:Holliday junction resolvasome RuvABC endonuclease subunit